MNVGDQEDVIIVCMDVMSATIMKLVQLVVGVVKSE